MAKLQTQPKNKAPQSVEQFAPDTTTSMQAPKRLGRELSVKITDNKKLIIIILLVVAGVGAFVFGVKSYLDLRHAKSELNAIKNDPNAQSKEEAKKIVEQVRTLAELPENEEPTVATVTDPTKLADQPFFANSKEGDKVLIYTSAKRAILYRPSTHKIIEIAPLNLGDNIDQMSVPTATEDEEAPAPKPTTTKPSNSQSKANTNSNTQANSQSQTKPSTQSSNFNSYSNSNNSN